MEDYNDSTKIAVVEQDIKYIKEKINAVDEKISKHYVTKEEFDPIKNIVYGVVSLILIAVVGALIGLIIQGDTI